jgi:isocitrate/isopropylmalate dehydrogenase
VSRRRYSVTCLARHGIGPEVLAAASRALAATARLHGLEIDDVHVPFGADAVTRFGLPFPPASRHAVVNADAVLVASRSDAAVDALEDELDLRASIGRVRFDGRSELTIVAPLRDESWPWALERARSLACTSRGRVSLVGVDERWEAHARATEARGDGLEVERLGVAAATRALVFTPARFDVVVVPPGLAATAREVAASFAERRTSAWGRLAASGPSVFGADHGAAEDLAGHGVADPSSMLLAAALMLGAGLGERGAGSTLAGAVGLAVNGNGAPPSTRHHADVVLAHLPLAFENAEFYREAACG